MRKGLVFVATSVALLLWGGAAQAAGVLAYSFEGAPPPDGFGPNGGGVTVAQDTIGTTEGANSMSISVVGPASFVGALTGNVHPSIGDPPGLSHILFDLTIVEPVASGFADLGVTIFTASQPGPGQQFGLPLQFRDVVSFAGLAAGTYLDQRIDLNDSHPNPLTFEDHQTFNEAIGTVGSGPNDLIPTGFQFFLNKTGGAEGVPVTIYIDNVRTVVPEPAAFAMLGLGAIVLGAVARRRSR